ncbi:hypothetical protein M8J76_000589 [Diaphorina citri]|nr:hypothetical protein M8J76_000589 [Diaphorina citri]KAI5721145.1 hypothetical protein M8J77_016867 [Diaphorina citri]
MAKGRKSGGNKNSDDDVQILETNEAGVLQSSSDNDMTECKQLLMKMNKKMETMEKKMNQVLAVVESQKKKISELEKEVKNQKVENNMLKENLEKSQELIDELQQRSRLNNIIINGVRQEKNEDVYKLVENLGKTLGIMDPIKDIQIAHRVSTTKKDKIKPIVVRMANSSTRDKWTNAYRKKQLWQQNIYINEHLTKKNQQLLFKCKQLKQTHNFKYVWVKDCKVLVRKDENARIIAIRNEKDLSRIMPLSHAVQNPIEDRLETTEDFASASSSNF